MSRRRATGPLWVVATCVLLIAGFVVAVTHGRVIDSIIIGVLMLPALAFVILWATGRTH